MEDYKKKQILNERNYNDVYFYFRCKSKVISFTEEPCQMSKKDKSNFKITILRNKMKLKIKKEKGVM